MRRWTGLNPSPFRKSVYEQIKWAIKFLEVEEYFEYKLSPLEIIYKERGKKAHKETPPL